MKNKKKLIITGIIIVLVLVFIISNIIKSRNQEPTLDYEIGKIEKQTLMNSISSSGTLNTEESKNVTSVLVGSKITDVKVKVGDKVEIGDTLVTFDTETLRKTANDLASSINSAKEQTNISINTADRAVQDAENARSTSLDQAKTAKDQAQSAYDQATQAKNSTLPALNSKVASLQAEIATYVPIEQKYNQATDTVAKAQVAYNTAETNRNNLQNQYNQLVSTLDPSLVGSNEQALELNAKLLAANTALTASASALTSSQDALKTAKASYDSISERYETLKQELASTSAQIASLSQAVEQTKIAYEQAEKAYTNASANLDSAILSAKDAAASVRIGANTSTLTLEQQLTATNKQLEDSNLKSTVSGTVTAVNVKKGDTYQGGTLLTIEGVESFIVEVNIDEYDIADIEEGMEAIIKTDATRDEELSGRVTFVSPISNSSSSSNMSSASSYPMASYSAAATGTGASYLVKVEILTPNDRLRLGMSAKVSIITEKVENTLCVPYDAISEKDDGTKIITLLNDDDSKTEVEVQVGLESGYYSEVKSDKIKEGMKVVLPKVDRSTTVDELLDSMGATGGIE